MQFKLLPYNALPAQVLYHLLKVKTRPVSLEMVMNCKRKTYNQTLNTILKSYL